MGTNFRWATAELTLPTGETMGIDTSEPRVHIGKRSAAGLYCWDCDVTLYRAGRDRIRDGPPGGYRRGESWEDEHRRSWLPACPTCGQPPAPADGMREGPAAVELGFAQAPTQRPTGVRGCSSFSWAQEPEGVGAICDQRPDDPIIQDEYGALLTGRQFLDMLRVNCPIQYTDMIGHEFS